MFWRFLFLWAVWYTARVTRTFSKMSGWNSSNSEICLTRRAQICARLEQTQPHAHTGCCFDSRNCVLYAAAESGQNGEYHSMILFRSGTVSLLLSPRRTAQKLLWTKHDTRSFALVVGEREFKALGRKTSLTEILSAQRLSPNAVQAVVKWDRKY